MHFCPMGYPHGVNSRRALLAIAGFAACISAAYAYQREFRDFPGEDQMQPVSRDQLRPSEFVFGRLMYPSGGGGGRFRGFGRDWRQGGRTNWTNDYPAGDRHLMTALVRLTRIDGRPIEQPINLEDGDDIFNWPFLFAARTTSIDLNSEMAAKLREYLDRGGFFIADDMWGPNEQQAIAETVKQLYPNRELVELPDDAQAFHMLFDLDKRYQILGQWARFNGMRPLDGVSYDPHFKGVFDEKGRMTMAAWFNNDTGDSWEWADDPSYPEKFSALGIRIMLNYVVYSMSH
jgi:hypothetical protein